MELNDYQRRAGVTAIYPRVGSNLNYPVVSLGGEVGELLNKWQKVLRDKQGVPTQEDAYVMAQELGDCLWTLQQTATELGYSLEAIAHMNLEKLASRHARGVLGGAGDER